MAPWGQAILALLSLSWSLSSASQQKALGGSSPPTTLPKVKSHLTPAFYDNGTAAYLQVQMEVQNDVVLAGQPILQHPFSFGTAPMVDYNGSSLRFTSATCKEDQVYTRDVEDPAPRQWFCTEDLVGNYTVQFVAKPRIGSESESCGPPAALERDADGVIGSGFAFLPELVSDAELNMTIGWDLQAAPQGVRAVSSFGDSAVSSVVGTPFLISDSAFAVGHLRSFSNHSTSSNYAMYWFGIPTFNATDLAQRAGSFYTQAAKVFHDEKAPFRIFLRRAVNRCISSEAFFQSFIMMWSPLSQTSSEEYFDIVAHEIVHNWPLLESNEPKSGTKVGADAWWSEGIANYLSSVLSFRFGIYDEEHYVRQMNEEVHVYYTSPAVNAAYQNFKEHFWSGY